MNGKILIPVLFCSAAAFISCSGKYAGSKAVICSAVEESCESPALAGSTRMSKMMTAAAPTAVSMDSNFVDNGYAYDQTASVTDTAALERKIIKTGNVSLEISSLEEISSAVQKMAENYGGYVTDTYADERNFSATIKVPCENFDSLMENTGSLGKIKSKSENASDVTDNFYDLDSRIRDRKILKEKLEQYLTQAKDMQDLLEIERQLNSVISDLDSMEGRMKRLTNQISYSTVYLNAYLPSGQDRTGFIRPDLSEKFRSLGSNTLNFLSKLLMGIFYLVIFGIPVVAVIAFLYWLLFGRIGLLIKLFKFLSKRK